jgi:hypothetical protein
MQAQQPTCRAPAIQLQQHVLNVVTTGLPLLIPTSRPAPHPDPRYLIQLLPAAVVAPLYFSGKIDFGVINQSQSAFNHILGDVSLVVYQFDALAGGGVGGAG